jgi:hypothetical protein
VFYFFDEREGFQVANTQAIAQDIFDLNNPAARVATYGHGNFTAAQNGAGGGKPDYLVVITGNDSWLGIADEAWEHETRFRGGRNAGQYSLIRIAEAHLYDWERHHVDVSQPSDPMPPNLITGGVSHPVTFLQFPPRRPPREEGTLYGSLPFAHELGHAIGLCDEYIVEEFHFTNGWETNYPAYQLRLTYAPYSPSENMHSMMGECRVPRMHGTFYTLNFFESAIRNGDHGIDRFVPDPNRNLIVNFKGQPAGWAYRRGILTRDAAGVRHRRIGGAPPEGTELPLDCMRPVFRTPDNFSFGVSPNQNRIALELFDVGQDRSSVEQFFPGQAAKNIQFQAVLVIRVLCEVEFEDGIEDAFWMPLPPPPANQRGNGQQRMQDLEFAWASLLPGNNPAGTYSARNNGYFLRGGTARSGVQNIFCHFIHGVRDSANAQTSWHIVFNKLPAGSGNPVINRAGRNLTIAFNANSDQIRRTFLGLPADPATGANPEQEEFDALNGFVTPLVNGWLSETFTFDRCPL